MKLRSLQYSAIFLGDFNESDSSIVKKIVSKLNVPHHQASDHSMNLILYDRYLTSKFASSYHPYLLKNNKFIENKKNKYSTIDYLLHSGSVTVKGHNSFPAADGGVKGLKVPFENGKYVAGKWPSDHAMITYLVEYVL